ncbi:hypothetical protein [Pseudanabaena sp. ABRG5-3]|uniref:hypothetical protein n=1 Tax=Pseudanabaena sp. ABRG5-3 TaxID=685565 RepID=UPI000DC73A2C|nr:hypothetical protein [Pseudanabaena sp. ABRG5-3]BBC24122.1 hypothetical protein ABRG53_1865 [Pseudanabaena sp. ABRG5-3]
MAIIHDVAHDANWCATEQMKDFWEDFKLVVMSSPMIHLDEKIQNDDKLTSRLK